MDSVFRAAFPGWLAVLWVWATIVPLGAHPVSLTSSLVNVEEEAITVELEMMVEDLVFYYEMEHDENFEFPLEALRERAREHEAFLLQYFQLRDGDGHRLEGGVTEIDFEELEETDGVHFDDLMAYSLVYTLVYPIQSTPEFLTVSQEFGGPDPVVPAEMEVSVFHEGMRVDSRVELSHRSAHTFTLDPHPGDGAADGGDLESARERREARQAEALGITSYSSVYSYVYVTDTEVRHEMLIPLLTLDEWLPLEREDPDFLSVAEQETARAPIFEFLKSHQRVDLNGETVEPELYRLEFFGPEARDLARETPQREMSVYNTRVGVILSFPAHEAPRRMTFEWDYFDQRMPVLRPRIYLFEEESHDALLDSFRTTFEWEREHDREGPELLATDLPEAPPQLHLPIASILGGSAAVGLAVLGICSVSRRRRFICLAIGGGFALGAVVLRPYAVAAVPHPLEPAPEVSDAQARAIFEVLHENIYRAFEYRHEERIYDALDQSVAGALLEDFYLQIRENLLVQEQGGAVSRVDEIALLDGSKETASGAVGSYPAFKYECAWTVTGTVEHWGHVHTRTNRYEAAFTVQGFPEGWKITGFEPHHEEPVQRRVRLRQ